MSTVLLLIIESFLNTRSIESKVDLEEKYFKHKFLFFCFKLGYLLTFQQSNAYSLKIELFFNFWFTLLLFVCLLDFYAKTGVKIPRQGIQIQ